MENSADGVFLVLNGDGLFATDYARFVRLSGLAAVPSAGPAREAPPPAISLALKYSEDLSRYGSVTINGDSRIVSFREKSARECEGYINAGAYLMDRRALQLMPRGKFSIETEVFQSLNEKQILGGIPCGGKFVDIGTPESFTWAQTHLPGWLKERFQPCLFLDRDGVLIEHLAYLHKPEDVVLVPEAIELLRHVRSKGWHTVVVTNQSGVARGFFSEADCLRVHQKIDSLLEALGLKIDAWFSCMTHPEEKSQRIAARVFVENPIRE